MSEDRPKAKGAVERRWAGANGWRWEETDEKVVRGYAPDWKEGDDPTFLQTPANKLRGRPRKKLRGRPRNERAELEAVIGQAIIQPQIATQKTSERKLAEMVLHLFEPKAAKRWPEPETYEAAVDRIRKTIRKLKRFHKDKKLNKINRYRKLYKIG